MPFSAAHDGISEAPWPGQVLRDVDHEDVRDADLGDVLAAESPAGRVRRGWVVLGLSRVVLRVSR